MTIQPFGNALRIIAPRHGCDPLPAPGWQNRFFRLLDGTPDGNSNLLEMFKRDIDIWAQLRKVEGKMRIQQALEKRHAFLKVSIQQYIQACHSLQFAAEEPLRNLVRQRARLLIQTQIVEDIIGTQKNTDFTSAQKKFKKPEASMAAALRQEVLNKRHHHLPVSCDLNFESKTTRLAACAFKSDMGDRSLDFGRIVSASPSPPWWSPGPGDHMTPHADIQTLRDAVSRGGFGLLEYAWSSEMFDASHKLLFRLPDVHAEDQWFYALGFFRNSSVIAWPCTLVRLRDSDSCFVEFDQPGVEPILIGVFQVERVSACSVRWVSWAAQMKEFTRLGDRQQLATPAIRAFVDGKPEALCKVAAKKAFWSLKVPFLTTLANHLGLELSGCSSLCEVVFRMVQGVLGVDDLECANILSLRLARNDISATYSQQITNLDEAIDCMDAHDAKRVKEEQREVENERRERAVFVSEYGVRRRAIDDSRLAGRRKAKAKAKSAAAPTRPVFEGVIPQSVAKGFLPVGASIWKDRTRGAWNAHVPPRARVSEPYADNEALALHRILRRAWLQHLEINGLDFPAHCPYEFDV